MKHLQKSFTVARIESGKLIANKQAIAADVAMMKDGDVSVSIEPYKRLKTWEQLKAFHGPILQQIQADVQNREGVFKSLDRIKDELKNKFLTKEKKYWSDGSPVLLQIAHPEKKGVTMTWHFEETPSLADLTVEEMNGFISEILEFYLHEQGLDIQIDSPERT